MGSTYTSLYTHLVGVLTDLKNSYLELVGGHLWERVGHLVLDQHNSSFNITKGHNTKTPHDGLPWDEWVRKYAKCTHFGKIAVSHSSGGILIPVEMARLAKS